MRYAQIDGGMVANIVEADLADVIPGLVPADDDTCIGWIYAGGAFAPPPAQPVPPAQIKAELTAAVQRHLDAQARARGYDGILSLCSYAASADPAFAAEAQVGVAWRDAVWRHCYQVLAEVEAALRTTPAEAELIAELPAMAWPA